MKKQYRIRPTLSIFSDYRIQCKRWWFPFWIRVGLSKTFYSIPDAQKWLDERLNPTHYKNELLPKLPLNQFKGKCPYCLLDVESIGGPAASEEKEDS